MIVTTDLVRGLSLSLLVVVMGCGSDKTALTIDNTNKTATAEISQVLTRACLARHWAPTDPELDPSLDLPAAGNITIAHGESYDLELPPGCHDIVVTRNSETARARVVLDVGETATWVPFDINENDSWWCYSEENCK